MPFSHTKTQESPRLQALWELPLTTGQPPWKKGLHFVRDRSHCGQPYKMSVFPQLASLELT